MKLIYRQENKENLIDYLEIFVLFPRAGKTKSISTWSGQQCKWIGINARSELSYSIEEDVDWRITLQILGFGFSIHRQWGY